jgi:hypothetical protein
MIRLEEIATQQKQANKSAKKKKGKKVSKKGGQTNGSEAVDEQSFLKVSIEDDEDMVEFLQLTVKRTLCRGIVRVSSE